MTQIHVYDRTKQHYLDKLEILNARAYHFYIRYKDKCSRYELKKLAWKSEFWHEAKCVFKLLNEHLYGKLTCEHCFEGFYHPYLKSFQLHHIKHEYVWDQLFDPDKILLVHKHCHRDIHQINKRGKK